jgi:transcription initiation factor TFIIE subunit alpha
MEGRRDAPRHRHWLAQRESHICTPLSSPNQNDPAQQLDNKGYICPLCNRSYTPLDADKIADYERGVFICEDCKTELIDNENAENVRGSQDRMQRFNYQMRFIREGLRKSEEMVMPQ